VWLGEPDPIKIMDEVRNEDTDLANIREFFELWLAYDLELCTGYTTARIIETACCPLAPNNYAPQTFKQLLLRVAARKDAPDVVSAERLGWWLRNISGRVVSITDANGQPHRYRLLRNQGKARHFHFQLVEV
jgi:hypothetical protein